MSAQPTDPDVLQQHASRQGGLEPVLVLTVTGNVDKGFDVEITSDLSQEMVGALLQQAADEALGRNDRASGAWGR